MDFQYPLGTHKGLLLVAFVVLFAASVQAQSSETGHSSGETSLVADTLELQEIEVTATRIEQPLSYQPTDVEVLDSLQLRLLQDQNIGQLLSSGSSLFIKDNGPGSYANASQRGLSSEQIQVLWEGIPINNVMLGQKDLALLPSSFFSSAEVSSGTPSSAFGGGSLSGAIYLSSDWRADSQLSLQQQVGSYGQRKTSFNGQYQSKEWQLSLRSAFDYAANDFEYYNRAYDTEEQRSHNEMEQQNVMASAARTWENSRLESKIWISSSENQIPGTILNSNNEARQEDRAVRWLSSFHTQVGDADITVKNYLDRVELDYFDPEINTRSISTNQSWMVSSDIRMQFNRYFLMKGEISGAITGAETNNYNTTPSRQQLSGLINPEITIPGNRLRIYPALRMDTYSDFGSVISPSLGMNLALLQEQLFLRGQVSRDFNPPSFNALYWGQGGNPELQPERSNSVEAGLTYTPNLPAFRSLRLTAYHSRVEDGIRWYPDDRGIYTPSNVEEITSRGVEGRMDNRLMLPGRLQLNLRQSVSYTRAELTKSRFAGDAAVGNQLRYVPHWKYSSSLSLQKGVVKGLLQFRQVGRRYITGTENLRSSLDPYGVLDATLQFSKTVGDFNLMARTGVRNLLNADYEVVQWYPMPRRNYSFSVTIAYPL